MKNVLVINQFASLPENSYGAGERMYHLSQFLVAKGYRITVVSGSYNHLFKNYPDASSLFNFEKSQYLDFLWIRLNKYKPNSFIGRVFSWFEFIFKLFFIRIEKIPDIVIISSMSLLPIIYGVWMKFRYKSKFILEIRDIWPLTPMEIGGFSKYNPLIFFLRRIELFGYRNADHIVSVLPGFKRYLNENSFGLKPFTWIPNGVADKEHIHYEGKRKYLNSRKFNVLYAGTFGRANALEAFIDAAKILSNNEHIHITLIGDGPLESQLKIQAGSLTNVTFIPKVLKAELSSILGESDVCYIGWHNKRIYSYGVSANKYNDYMLARKIILSSSDIENDPVVLAKAGLQVPSNDPDAIAAAIVKIFNMNVEERINFGTNGYQFVTENQVYPILAEKYLSVFNQVLEYQNIEEIS